MNRLDRPVTLRALLVTAIAICALSTGVGATVSSVVLDRGATGPHGRVGPAGPRGVGLPGPEGPRGPRGHTGPPGSAADEAAITDAIEADASGVALAIEPWLDPSPADVGDDLNILRDDFDTLCHRLQFARALTDTVITC